MIFSVCLDVSRLVFPTWSSLDLRVDAFHRWGGFLAVMCQVFLLPLLGSAPGSLVTQQTPVVVCGLCMCRPVLPVCLDPSLLPIPPSTAPGCHLARPTASVTPTLCILILVFAVVFFYIFAEILRFFSCTFFILFITVTLNLWIVHRLGYSWTHIS